MQPRSYYLCFGALLLSGSVHAQVDISRVAAKSLLVEEINKAKNYEVKTLENEEFFEQMTDGGGKLTAWIRNGLVVKLVEWVGLSSCVNVTEYYFHDSQLVLVSVQGSEWAYVESTGSFDYTVQVITMEARFYFHDGKLIKSDLKGSTRCAGVPTKEWAANYKTEALRLKDLFMRKQ